MLLAEVEYARPSSVDVSIARPVGSMGERLLQPIVNQQVQNALTALGKQVASAT